LEDFATALPILLLSLHLFDVPAVLYQWITNIPFKAVPSVTASPTSLYPMQSLSFDACATFLQEHTIEHWSKEIARTGY
jgi:hypothetical protein